MKGQKFLKLTGAALAGTVLLTAVPVMALAQEDVEKAPVTVQEEAVNTDVPDISGTQMSASKVEDLRQAVREQVVDIQNPPEKIQGFEQYEKAGVPGSYVVYYDPDAYTCETLTPEEETKEEDALYLSLKTNPDVNLKLRFFPDMDKEEVIRLYNNKLNSADARSFTIILKDTKENQEGKESIVEIGGTGVQGDQEIADGRTLTVSWDDEHKEYYTYELSVPDIGTALLGADRVPSFAILTNTPGYFIEYYIAANKNGSVAVEVSAPETASKEFDDLRNIIDTLVMDETLWDQEEVMRYANKSSEELEDYMDNMEEQEGQIILDQGGQVVYGESWPQETEPEE